MVNGRLRGRCYFEWFRSVVTMYLTGRGFSLGDDKPHGAACPVGLDDYRLGAWNLVSVSLFLSFFAAPVEGQRHMAPASRGATWNPAPLWQGPLVFGNPRARTWVDVSVQENLRSSLTPCDDNCAEGTCKARRMCCRDAVITQAMWKKYPCRALDARDVCVCGFLLWGLTRTDIGLDRVVGVGIGHRHDTGVAAVGLAVGVGGGGKGGLSQCGGALYCTVPPPPPPPK